MNPCTDRRGHEWSSADPELTWAPQYGKLAPDFPHTVFRGTEAVMVVCLRPKCPEIGYRVVAQNVSQQESA